MPDLPPFPDVERARCAGAPLKACPPFLDQAGELAALIRGRDWGETALGPPEQWPSSLRSAVSLMLRSLQPVYLAWGPQLTALYNDAHRPFLGTRHPDALGMPSEAVWLEAWPVVGPFFAAAMAGQAQWHEDVPLELEGGGRRRRWFSFSFTPIEDDDGHVQGVLSLATETTSKVLAEQRMAAESARQLRLFEQAPGFICTTAGPEHVFDFVNAEHRKLFDSGQWVGRTVREAFPEKYGGRVVEQLERVYVTGERLVMRDVRMVRDDSDPPGSTCYLDFVYEPLLDPAGRVVGIFCQGSDVTDRVCALRAMAASEEQLRLATDAAEVALWDVDVTTGKVYWQPRLKAMFGVPADAEVGMEDFFGGLHPEDRQASRDAVAAAMDPAVRAHYDLEYRTAGDDGMQRWVAAKGRCLFNESGACVRMIGTAIDITHRKRTEAQLRDLNETLERRVEEQTAERMKAEDALRQAHKMEAVGQLTGGIAHDFNNMLGAVVGSFELIQRRPADLERVLRHAETGLQAAERGTRLTSQLLAFSRAQQIEMKPLVVAGVVQSMREMLGNALGPMVRLSLDLDGHAVPVLADSTQLEMAVLNLAINARDAMPEGGEVDISTCLRALDHDLELADGEYVELRVCDSGAGMDPEVAARAFEPFFTTKGVGKGTGLGLSQVYGIARQAGGSVRLESEPGKGTTVRILLPRAPGAANSRAGLEPAHAPVAQAAVTVLVVDDDPNVREVLVETLDALGYRVLEAEDGPSGLAALQAGAPDLLMLDFAMPGMNGAEVAKIALELRPDLPIVFATGYADTAAITQVAGPDALVLRKPFRVNELQAMLELALQSMR